MSDNKYNNNSNKYSGGKASPQKRSAQASNRSAAAGKSNRAAASKSASVNAAQKSRSAQSAPPPRTPQTSRASQTSRTVQNSQNSRTAQTSRTAQAQKISGGTSSQKKPVSEQKKTTAQSSQTSRAAQPQRKSPSAPQTPHASGSDSKTRSGYAGSQKNSADVRKKSSANAAPKKPESKASDMSEQDARLLKHKKKILRQTRRREQSLASFNVAVIIAVFAFATLFMTFGVRSTVSVEEKRELAKMPEFTLESYFDGSFADGFAEFYNDTVPMRSSFMSFISAFRGKLGLKYGEEGAELIGGLPTLDKPPEPPNTAEVSKKPLTPGLISSKPSTSTTGSGSSSAESSQPEESSSSSAAEQTDPPKVDGELSGSVLVLDGGWGISLFGGGYGTGQNYANTLNKIKKAVGNDVNVYSLVSPTSGSFYLPAKYKGWMASEPDNINNINSYLDGVIPIDAYGALKKHTDEAIFARTDHHWNQLGAYYAAEEFAKTAGVYFAPLSDYDAHSMNDHMGTMLAYSNYHATIANNPETFTYYVPKNSFSSTMYDEYLGNPQQSFVFYPPNLISANSFNGCKDYYGVFFGGADNKVFRVKTDVQNGRKLIIMKDSYGNAIVPCLTNSFEEIWLVDMRFLKTSIVQLAKDEGITDILFAMNTFSATGGNQQTMANLQLPFIN